MHRLAVGHATLVLSSSREGVPMPGPETYDVWVVSDPDGPVLYFPVASSSDVAPREHAARCRQMAARTSSPEGLIHGVWPRTRQRLAGPGAGLVAEIADPEVETRRAAQRAATMARGADAAAWAPEELLAAPEAAPGPARRAAMATPAATPRQATPRPPARRPAADRAAPAPAEPTEAVCRSCFMMRRVELLEDGVCSFCR